MHITFEQVPSVKGTDGYSHMPILRSLAARKFVRFWASGGAKFSKTTVQHLTPLCLSWPEKSVTVQTKKHANKQ